MDGCMYGQPNYLASASRSTYLQHTLAKCTWKSIVFHITYIFFLNVGNKSIISLIAIKFLLGKRLPQNFIFNFMLKGLQRSNNVTYDSFNKNLLLTDIVHAKQSILGLRERGKTKLIVNNTIYRS